jgi:Icc-related predicted phosphoesterase
LRIAAVADIHSPRFINEFTKSLKQCQTPDVFLFAGDIVNRGIADEYLCVVDLIERTHGEVPIIACFGNEEYIESRNEIVSLVGDRVIFLDESTTTLSITGSCLGVVGTSVILDQPLGLTEIKDVFEKRAKRVSKLLESVAKISDHTILLLHYSPLSEEHHDSQSFSWWVSRAVEEVKPTLIVHGHIHNSKILKTKIETTSVYNVALPAVGSITELIL